jgi:hypothetical protein
MFCNISPTLRDKDMSERTLQFGHVAKNVSLIVKSNHIKLDKLISRKKELLENTEKIDARLLIKQQKNLKIIQKFTINKEKIKILIFNLQVYM